MYLSLFISPLLDFIWRSDLIDSDCQHWLEVMAIVVSPIPWWVGPYARLVKPYLDGGSPYLTSPPGGAVLSAQRGAGMAFVWT
jgi:hypothetical protein